MQSKNKSTLLSILWGRITGAWKVKHGEVIQSVSPLTPYRLYRTCHELPLPNFEQCLCDEDLSALIIEGNPPVFEIQKAWIGIYHEFIDLSDSVDIREAKKLQKAILVLRTRLMRINATVRQLATWAKMDSTLQAESEIKEIFVALVQELRDLNFRYKFDPSNPIQYVKDLQMVLTRSSTWSMELKMKEAEHEAYMAKQSGGKVERIYFTQALIRMAGFFKFHINKQDLNVAEYCEYKRQYIEHCDQIKQQNNARK